MHKPVYLDYNATTPVAPRVFEAMTPYLRQHFGNPSSGHAYGKAPRQAHETARAQVAACLGARPDEIFFTSGGTESNNHAIFGICRALRHKGDHIVISAVEHPAVENVCRRLEGEGWRVTRLPVDSTGRVSPGDLRTSISDHTVLVSIMLANNEVGTIQPIAELAAITRERGVPLHTDAAQAIGKIPVNVDDLGVDLLSVAGHKLYAPKGIGALYIRRGTPIERLMEGAGQEMGVRPGTENVAYSVALGEACRLANEHLTEHAAHMRTLRDRLHERLLDAGLEPRLNGHPDLRLPNTLNIGFKGLLANELLDAISDTVACSAGSACHTGCVSASPVLQAMGVPEEWSLGVLRLSTGRFATEEEIDAAAGAIIAAVRRLRKEG